MSERDDLGCMWRLAQVIACVIGWTIVWCVAADYFELRERVSALESRAAFFVPEGQEHPQEVKRDE